METPLLLVTSGDPAGIGPDILLQAAATKLPGSVVAVGDRRLLKARAELLRLDINVVDYVAAPPLRHRAGILPVIHHPCHSKVVVGVLQACHAEYVVKCIDAAVDLCLTKQFDAMITGPVNKAMLNQAGLAFCGHTEWIAERCHAPSPVMMLASRAMRVCLLSTHVPLACVAAQVTASRLTQVIHIILNDLRRLFQIKRPRLGVCALNPHAGDGGYIGQEEINVIAPTVAAVRAQGADIVGPIAADTAFTPPQLAHFDAVLAMYHDQGLPVIKHASFGETVNLTLGLPIIRTSVDHGTAAELAGTGKASSSSLQAALALASQLSAQQKSLD